MKLLYIDRVTSFSEVRIGERTIFGEKLHLFDCSVDFLLMGRKNNKTIKKKSIYYRPDTYIWKTIFGFDFFVTLFYIVFLHKKYKYDAIICRKNLTIGYAGLLISLILKIPFVYMLSFPKWEMIKIKGKKSSVSIFYEIFSKFYEKMTAILVKNSDLTIAKTQYFWNSFSKKHNLYNTKNIAIPMGFDVDRIIPKIEKINLRRKHGIHRGKKVILYFGSIDKERNITFLIDVFARTKNFYSDVLLLVIGGNSKQQEPLKKYSKIKEVQNDIIFIENQKRSILNEYIVLSDISISPIPPLPVYIISSPTKVVESMALATPVIANVEILEHVELISESEGGVLVEYNIQDFSYALQDLLKDDLKIDILSKNAQEYIIKNRDYSVLAKKVYSAIKETINEKK